MTMISVSSLQIPSIPFGLTSSWTTLNSSNLNASGVKFASILQAPKTGSIRKIHFRVGGVTTATDTDVRIETVDPATGEASGTLWGTNTNVTVLQASITSNTWIVSPALTADASVTQGDTFAVVLAPTGTPSYIVTCIGGASAAFRFPYVSFYNGTSWIKESSLLPSVGIEYSDGSFADMPQVIPLSATPNVHAFNSGSTPDERALKFKLPVPVKVCGAWVADDLDGDGDLVLYDSDGTTALQTKSLDKDVRQGTTTGVHLVRFPGSQLLLANTFYRLSIKPTSATSLTVYSIDVNSAALFDQMPGGQNFHYSERTDAGAWTDTTTRRLFMGLMIDGVDDGSGGGSTTNVFIHSE